MRVIRTLLGVLVIVACKPIDKTPPPPAAPPPPPGPTKVASVEGFLTPESVLHDSGQDIYFVSNINGSPTAKDNNGFISRLKPDGAVENLKFIEGGKGGVVLNAPKGLALHGDTLWVADIDVVRSWWEAHSCGAQDHNRFFWSLIVLESWARLFLNGTCESAIAG